MEKWALLSVLLFVSFFEPLRRQLHENREACIYVSHLPAAITVQKMEAVLEMEADCSVQEVFLLKVSYFLCCNKLWFMEFDISNCVKNM